MNNYKRSNSTNVGNGHKYVARILFQNAMLTVYTRGFSEQVNVSATDVSGRLTNLIDKLVTYVTLLAAALSACKSIQVMGYIEAEADFRFVS